MKLVNYDVDDKIIGASLLLTASSGTVTINADSTVQILAEDAHPLDRFDPQVCI